MEKVLDFEKENIDENITIIIEGDFNLEIGRLGSIEEEGIELGRNSKDKIIGNGGRELVDWIGNKSWYVLNGAFEGNWDGEFTYVGPRGCTVIDYVLTNEIGYEKNVRF